MTQIPRSVYVATCPLCERLWVGETIRGVNREIGQFHLTPTVRACWGRPVVRRYVIVPKKGRRS